MAVETSLEKIIKAFETFADKHMRIEQFSDEVPNSVTAKNWVYPIFVCVTGDADINTGETRQHFIAFFLDRAAGASPNPKELRQKLSDTRQTVKDFVTYFNKNDQQHGFKMVDNVVATPVQMEFDDRVFGWNLSFITQEKFAQNENLLPL